MRLGGEFAGDLVRKADADFESRRREFGEQPVVVAAASPAARARSGEGDAGDEDEIYVLRRDDARGVGDGLAEAPFCWLKFVERGEAVQREGVVFYTRVGDDFSRCAGPELLNVWLARLWRKERHGARGLPLRERGDGGADACALRAAHIGRQGQAVSHGVTEFGFGEHRESVGI